MGGGAGSGGSGVAGAQGCVGGGGQGEFVGGDGGGGELCGVGGGGDPHGWGAAPSGEVEVFGGCWWGCGEFHGGVGEVRGGEFQQEQVAAGGGGIGSNFFDGRAGVVSLGCVWSEENFCGCGRAGGQGCVVGGVWAEAARDGRDPVGLNEGAGARAVTGDNLDGVAARGR